MIPATAAAAALAAAVIGLPAAVAAAGPLQTTASAATDLGPDPRFASVEFTVGATCPQCIADTVRAVLAAGCAVRTKVDTALYCGASFGCSTPSSAASIVTGLEGSMVSSYSVNKRLSPKALPQEARPDAAPVEKIHVATGVNDARTKLGLTGNGVKVAILDSGVYYKHPALGGCFGPGCKVAFGYDLVGDTYGSQNQTVVPDSDPIDDCSTETHGTHVAAALPMVWCEKLQHASPQLVPPVHHRIVAGNALNISVPGFIPDVPWTGVAPDATLGAYRIFGCVFDYTYDDVISAAIYMAADDGADIINLSIGGGPVFPDSDGVAVSRVSAAGVIVAGANGNDGKSGYMVNSNPGGALGGFGVGSFDNIEIPAYILTVDGAVFPWSGGLTNSSFQLPTETLDIFVNNPDAAKNNVQDDGCSFVNKGAAGKTVLLRFGSVCGSRARCTNAQNAGAKNCLVYSNDDTLPLLTGGFIPTASTSKAAGACDYRLSQVFPVATAGTVSSFSSPGLDAELHIKPDIGGIGGNVYSTISPAAAAAQGYPGPYALYSGTSMATPYFAGSVALYLEAKGKSSYENVRTAFQNTATVTKMYGRDLVGSVALQGSGLLNVYNAVTAKTVVTPSYLALNDTQFTSKTHYTITLANNYNTSVSYTVANSGAATVNMFDGIEDYIQNATGTSYTSNYASLGFGNKQETVFTTVVAAGASTQINVKVTQPSADPKLFPIFSGYIKITNNIDDSTINVPYAGMVGNWKEAPIFSVNAVKSFGYRSGFYRLDNSPFSGGVVNLTNEGVGISPIYATTTRLTYIEVVFAGNNQTVKNQLNKLGLGHGANQGFAFLSTSSNGPLDFLPYGVGQRNTPVKSQGVFAGWGEVWNGYVCAAPTCFPYEAVRLPPGDYKLRLKGMHHMTPGRYTGDENFEIIVTPLFTVVY
ncbi:peptidase S8/S53 domain-containing protein [Zopfochytrium polystomum]|nr:peptidase S8/S53 domain-containing protein [Zopfochytrium polystomum]